MSILGVSGKQLLLHFQDILWRRAGLVKHERSETVGLKIKRIKLTNLLKWAFGLNKEAFCFNLQMNSKTYLKIDLIHPNWFAVEFCLTKKDAAQVSAESTHSVGAFLKIVKNLCWFDLGAWSFNLELEVINQKNVKR